MALTTGIIAGVSALASAGSTIHQIASSNAQADEAKKAADAQKAAQEGQIQEAKTQQANVNAQQEQVGQTALIKKLAGQTPGASSGMGGTILTSPLGTPGGDTNQPGGAKTLLGA